MWKKVHWEISRAPVMPEVSADRKYVCRSGVVCVTPERMTKNSSTMEPARKMRDSGARNESERERRLSVESPLSPCIEGL